jgi:hypothetical protein
MARGSVAPTSGSFLRSSAHRDDLFLEMWLTEMPLSFVRVAPDLEALLGQMCDFVTWLVWGAGHRSCPDRVGPLRLAPASGLSITV